MSQNEFKVKLIVDDTAVKQLAATMNGIFTKNGSKSKQGSSGGTNNPIQSLLKLGAIATGIGTLVMGVKKLVDFTVDSSPMLKSMLQLFNNAMMFIFRPIGDFIGFILRPIVLQLLRFAIPFYKALEPFAQRYGTQLGNLITNLLAIIMDPSALLKGVVINAGSAIGSATSSLSSATSSISNFITSTLTGDMDNITNFFTTLSNNVETTMAPAWSIFSELFSSIQSTIGYILKGWDAIYGFFTNLQSTVNSIVTPAWTFVTGFFSAINTAGKDLLKGWDMLYGFFSGLGSGIQTLGQYAGDFVTFFAGLGGALNNILTPIWNAFIQFWQDIQTFIKNITSFLQNPFGVVSGANSAGSSASSAAASAGTYIENLTVSGLQVASADLAAFFKNPQQYILKVSQSSQNKMPRS